MVVPLNRSLVRSRNPSCFKTPQLQLSHLYYKSHLRTSSTSLISLIKPTSLITRTLVAESGLWLSLQARSTPPSNEQGRIVASTVEAMLLAHSIAFVPAFSPLKEEK